MKAQEKPKYVQELRGIISKLDVRKLIDNPDESLVTQGVWRAKAIFINFDSGTGEKLQKIITEFVEVARAGRRVEHIQNLANDIRNYIVEKTEEMDVYPIDPIEVESQIKESDFVEEKIASRPDIITTEIYDVALSFAGEKREYVFQVASYLENKNIKVFYDDFPKQEVAMWGKNLRDFFGEIFAKKARFCVMFISKEYAEKTWPDFERQIIQARSMVEEGILLPARFDKTEIKGEIPTVKYIDLSSKTPEQFADIIIEKIREKQVHVSTDKQISPSTKKEPVESIVIPQSFENPTLYINPSFGSSGGPKGHFVYFTIKNVSKASILDISWGIRGFAYEWRPSPSQLFMLDPLKEKEVEYPISNELPFLKDVPELNIFLEYSDTQGKKFFSRREIRQSLVPSGAFYGLEAGTFHAPVLLVNDGVDFHSGPNWNGDRVEMKFKVENHIKKRVMISVSRTFLSVWGFTEIDFIKQALLELGFRKVRKMIKEDNLNDYLFVTDNFPQEYQLGLKGYQKLRDSI